MPTEISAVHPVLMAREVAGAIDFYSRLGFDVGFRNDPIVPQYATIQRGGVELHLQWADPTQWEHSGDRPAYRFLTSDVDALYAEFVASGAATTDTNGGPYAAPAETAWGTREFHLRDPGGNVLQFYRPSTADSAPSA